MAYNTLCGTVNFCNDSGSIESMVDDYSNQTIRGNKTFASTVSASAFYNTATGALLTSSAISTIAGDGAGRVVVSDGDGTATCYTQLTFDGSALTASIFSGSAAALQGIPLETSKVSGQLSASNIYFGNGLENQSSKLSAKAANGISVDSNGINVNTATTGGLGLAGTALRVTPNDATAKAGLSNGDQFLISDSDSGNALKNSTMAVLGTYMQSTLTFTSPGGSDSQVQYRSGGNFTGNSNFTYNGSGTVTTLNLSASGHVSSSQFVGNGSGLYNIPGASPGGTNQNVQFRSGSNFSGSSNLTFDFQAATNSLQIIGDVSASNDIIADRDLTVGRNLTVGGVISASSDVSGTAFHGRGDTLTTAPINNYTANRLVLCGASTNTIDTFSGLTWNNPTLNVPGTVVATNTVSSSYLHLSGATGNEVIRIAKSNTGTKEIVFEVAGADQAEIQLSANEVLVMSNASTKDIILKTNSQNTLRLFGATQRVGIAKEGTTANAELDVDGDAIISGSLIASASSGVAITSYQNPTGLSNDTGAGEVVLFGGGSTTAGKLYYLHTDSNWTEADADAVSTGADQMLGIALGANPAVDGILLRGYFDATTYLSNFSAGKAIYVDTTAANMNTTAPSAAGDFVRIVGYCTTTANVIYFNPSSEWIELA